MKTFGFYNHEGEEFGIVPKGKLEITHNGTRYQVKNNESFYYSSQIPHGWTNSTNEDTVAV